MTSAIPDGFSIEALTELLDSAPREDEIKQAHDQDCSGCPECDVTEQAIEDAAHEGLNLMCEKVEDPLVHKVALLKVANNMVAWHTKVGEAAMENGQVEMGAAWLRDAGKWQAVMDILMSIAIGPNDTYLIGHEQN